MKKYFLMLAVLLLSAAIVAPAFAAVEFKYGGMMRARIISQNNFDGMDEYDDHLNRIDERFRLYFTFKASENLQLVTKFEGNAVWGNPNTFGGVGADRGGNAPLAGDWSNFVVKNAYLDFAIPGTPTRALIGVQTITLLDSWIIDDDFGAAVFKTKLDPVVVTAGYIGAQNYDYSTEDDNIDTFFLSVDYKGGPIKASVIGLYQDAHDTNMSTDPAIVTNTPFRKAVGLDTSASQPQFGSLYNTIFSAFDTVPDLTNVGNEGYTYRLDRTDSNQLFDLGINLTYKLDWMSAYVNFVKNFGSVDMRFKQTETSVTALATVDEFGRVITPAETETETEYYNHSADYTGWMIDAGFNYFCGPWAFNVGGFYTTGQDIKDLLNGKVDDIDFFAYPAATTKYFSEIMGGGILDNTAPVHRIGSDAAGYLNQVAADNAALEGGKAPKGLAGNAADYEWVGYPAPTNLWTLTIGASYQVLEATKVSASYWYFASSEDVISGTKHNSYGETTGLKFDNSIGHEIDLNVTQGIVDGLTLDLVGAYMFAEDAFSGNNNDDDVYELGARLQWSF